VDFNQAQPLKLNQIRLQLSSRGLLRHNQPRHSLPYHDRLYISLPHLCLLHRNLPHRNLLYSSLLCHNQRQRSLFSLVQLLILQSIKERIHRLHSLQARRRSQMVRDCFQELSESGEYSKEL
jgi:hypothetical protein